MTTKRRGRPPRVEEPIVEEGVPPIQQLEVAENTSEPPSFKDRLIAKFQPSGEEKPAPKKRGKSSNQNELIARALPTVFTSFVVTISRNLLPDDYKMVAPSKEEVEAVLFPLFSIISRRVKISLAATADTLDLIALITASMTYATRAVITFEIIEKEKRNEPRKDIPRESGRDVGGDSDKNTNVRSGNTNSTSSHNEDSRRETELISELFRRDSNGRQQMGLSPRQIL